MSGHCRNLARLLPASDQICPGSGKIRPESGQILAGSDQNQARSWPDSGRIWPASGQTATTKNRDIYKKCSIVKLMGIVNDGTQSICATSLYCHDCYNGFHHFWPDPGQILAGSAHCVLLTDSLGLPHRIFAESLQIPSGFLAGSLRIPHRFLTGS